MSDLILTSILAAALAARPRRTLMRQRRSLVDKGEGGGKKSPDNFVAQGEKRRPGAALGNRNAAAHDPATVERRARHAAAQAVIDDTLAMADAAIAAADEDVKARKRLPMLLLAEAWS